VPNENIQIMGDNTQMKTRIGKHYGYSILVAGVIAGWGSESQAAQFPYFRQYHATGCITTSGSVTYHHQWGLYNPSTSSSATVVCPLVSESDVDGIFAEANVVVWDRHTSQNITCTFFNLDDWGSIVTSSSRTTSGFSSSSITLNWGWGGLFNRLSVLQCTLPPVDNGQQSYLTSYETELDQID
jgi:hypothetical protein